MKGLSQSINFTVQKIFKHRHLSGIMIPEQIDWTDYGSVLGHLFTAYELMIIAELSRSDTVSHEKFSKLGSALEKEVDDNYTGDKDDILSVLGCPQIVYESMAAAISTNRDALDYLRDRGKIPRHLVQ